MENEGIPRPQFVLFSEGYPCAMAILCAQHLGPYMERDQASFGATDAYKIRVMWGNKSCRVCQDNADVVDWVMGAVPEEFKNE